MSVWDGARSSIPSQQQAQIVMEDLTSFYRQLTHHQLVKLIYNGSPLQWSKTSVYL